MYYIVKSKEGEYLLFTIACRAQIARERLGKTLKITWSQAIREGYEVVKVTLQEVA